MEKKIMNFDDAFEKVKNDFGDCRFAMFTWFERNEKRRVNEEVAEIINFDEEFQKEVAKKYINRRGFTMKQFKDNLKWCAEFTYKELNSFLDMIKTFIEDCEREFGVTRVDGEDRLMDSLNWQGIEDLGKGMGLLQSLIFEDENSCENNEVSDIVQRLRHNYNGLRTEITNFERNNTPIIDLSNEFLNRLSNDGMVIAATLKNIGIEINKILKLVKDILPKEVYEQISLNGCEAVYRVEEYLNFAYSRAAYVRNDLLNNIGVNFYEDKGGEIKVEYSIPQVLDNDIFIFLNLTGLKIREVDGPLDRSRVFYIPKRRKLPIT